MVREVPWGCKGGDIRIERGRVGEGVREEEGADRRFLNRGISASRLGVPRQRHAQLPLEVLISSTESHVFPVVSPNCSAQSRAARVAKPTTPWCRGRLRSGYHPRTTRTTGVGWAGLSPRRGRSSLSFLKKLFAEGLRISHSPHPGSAVHP